MKLVKTARPFLLVVSVWLTGHAAAGTLVTPELLESALVQAGPGTTLFLAPGNYGTVTLRNLHGAEGRPIRLEAAEPAAPPVFGELKIADASHLELVGLDLDFTAPAGPDAEWARPFQVLRSTHILLEGLELDGDVARAAETSRNGYPTGTGLFIRGSDSLVLTDSEIRGFQTGIAILESGQVHLSRNEIHGIRRDGMNLAQVHDVLVEDNLLHSFDRATGSSDHPDMIQIWTTGTDAPSERVVIRNNVLHSGAGAWTQGIHMRNERVDQGLAGPELFYRDIRIEGNVIVNAHLNGINAGETVGLVIRRNTLVRNPHSVPADFNDQLSAPRIRVAQASQKVIVSENVAAGFPSADAPDWEVAGNLAIQHRFRLKPGFYGQIFTGLPGSDPHDLSALTYRSTGPLRAGMAGALRLAPPR